VENLCAAVAQLLLADLQLLHAISHLPVAPSKRHSVMSGAWRSRCCSWVNRFSATKWGNMTIADWLGADFDYAAIRSNATEAKDAREHMRWVSGPTTRCRIGLARVDHHYCTALFGAAAAAASLSNHA
jgi:hypothetical protein